MTKQPVIYVDTSVWVAMHAREARTAQLQDWLEQQELPRLCCSEWVKTEYASVLSIKRRRGDLSEEAFAGAHHAFAQLCIAGPVWIDVETHDFLTAAGYCADPDAGLRAREGLHLAVAVRTRCEALFSLDDLMNQNAKRLGLGVIEL